MSNNLADTFLILAGGDPDRRGTGSCVLCGALVNGFDDELSAREYEIYGLCQECQDLAFNEGECYEC